jgi:hypothetical protein
VTLNKKGYKRKEITKLVGCSLGVIDRAKKGTKKWYKYY